MNRETAKQAFITRVEGTFNKPTNRSQGALKKLIKTRNNGPALFKHMHDMLSDVLAEKEITLSMIEMQDFLKFIDPTMLELHSRFLLPNKN
jgi:hypothetical protein